MIHTERPKCILSKLAHSDLSARESAHKFYVDKGVERAHVPQYTNYTLHSAQRAAKIRPAELDSCQ